MKICIPRLSCKSLFTACAHTIHSCSQLFTAVQCLSKWHPPCVAGSPAAEQLHGESPCRSLTNYGKLREMLVHCDGLSFSTEFVSIVLILHTKEREKINYIHIQLVVMVSYGTTVPHSEDRHVTTTLHHFPLLPKQQPFQRHRCRSNKNVQLPVKPHCAMLQGVSCVEYKRWWSWWIC